MFLNYVCLKHDLALIIMFSVLHCAIVHSRGVILFHMSLSFLLFFSWVGLLCLFIDEPSVIRILGPQQSGADTINLTMSERFGYEITHTLSAVHSCFMNVC